MSISKNRPHALREDYAFSGSYRLVCSTGAVTVLAAATATAGQLFNFRNPSATVKCFIRYVGAKFILTTAYGTAQETGIDMILAHSFTVNGTNGTAIDVGSTVAATGKLSSADCATSALTAGCVRTATASTITAGTHTLDANPIGTLNDWSGAIGATVPTTSSGAAGQFGTLFSARGREEMPIVLGQNQGFLLRNTVLMGATGVGRWDFCVEWDEGVSE